MSNCSFSMESGQVDSNLKAYKKKWVTRSETLLISFFQWFLFLTFTIDKKPSPKIE